MKMNTQTTLYLTEEERQVLKSFAFLVMYDDGDKIKDLDYLLDTILGNHDEDAVNNIRIVVTEKEN